MSIGEWWVFLLIRRVKTKEWIYISIFYENNIVIRNIRWSHNILTHHIDCIIYPYIVQYMKDTITWIYKRQTLKSNFCTGDPLGYCVPGENLRVQIVQAHPANYALNFRASLTKNFFGCQQWVWNPDFSRTLGEVNSNLMRLNHVKTTSDRYILNKNNIEQFWNILFSDPQTVNTVY